MNSRERRKQRRKQARLEKAREDKQARLEKEAEAKLEELEVVEEDLESEEDVDFDVDEEDEEPEEVEKDYYGSSTPAVVRVPGPTTWDEMEAQRDAEKRASDIRMKSYDVEDLVYNIVNHPEFTPQEKANKIKAAGAGFGDRVTSIMDSPIQKALDTELLSLEALIAHDERNSTVVDAVSDFISKKKLSYGARKKLPDSAFALPSKRKYPIHDKAHVRNALARAAQQIKAGGEAAADAKAALPKIRAAAKKFGIDVSMDKERNAVVVEKDAKGDWRAVMWVSNNFIDYDRDIISKQAHEEYVAWLDEYPDMAPAFLSWHLPESVRKNRVDFWTFQNGFLLMSAKLEEIEAQALLKAQAETDLGMSHGSIVLERDPKDPRVILKYRMYEVSDLPLDKAANPFTDFETLVKEVGMDKLEYLSTILGEERAAAFLEKSETKQKVLREAEIEEKDLKPDPKPAEVEVKLDAEKILEQVMKELDIEGLAETIEKLKADAEKVPLLEDLVKKLAEKQEDQLVEMISPQKFPWSKVASKSDDTIIKKEEQDKDPTLQAPGIPEGDEYWLSQSTGIAPIPAEA